MHTTFTAIVISLIFSIGCTKDDDTEIKAGFVHYIGELYGGGIVVAVWDADGVEKGLIASAVDVSPETAWSNVGETEIGVAAQSTIDGQANTNAIIAQIGHTSSAAKICDDYVLGEFSDWYLPAKWELLQCYNSTFIVNTILGETNGFQLAAYWTSTESSIYNNIAWVQNFNHGEPNIYERNKDNARSCRVRAVRKF